MTLLLGWFIYYDIQFLRRGDRDQRFFNRANVDLDLKFILQMMKVKVIMRQKKYIWGEGSGGRSLPENFENLGWILTIFS